MGDGLFVKRQPADLVDAALRPANFSSCDHLLASIGFGRETYYLDFLELRQQQSGRCLTLSLDLPCFAFFLGVFSLFLFDGLAPFASQESIGAVLFQPQQLCEQVLLPVELYKNDGIVLVLLSKGGGTSNKGRQALT